jgi:hypothetical protein
LGDGARQSAAGPTQGEHGQRRALSLNEKSLTDAFLVRKADEGQVTKIEAVVKEEN